MEKFNQLLRSGQPYVLSIFRIMVGLSLFQFGVAKIFKFPVVAPFDKVQMFSLFWDAAVIEFVFGGLLILGLFSRVAAFILCGEMAFAYFIEHFPQSFFPLLNDGTLAIQFCFACLYLAAAGGGPLSLDTLLRTRAPLRARTSGS
jgi:putative oxidoreductase